MPDWFAKHAPKASAAPDWFSQHAPSPAPSMTRDQATAWRTAHTPQTPEQVVQSGYDIHPFKNPVLRAVAGPGRAILGILESPVELLKPPTNPEEVGFSSGGPLAVALDRLLVEPAEAAHSTATSFRSQAIQVRNTAKRIEAAANNPAQLAALRKQYPQMDLSTPQKAVASAHQLTMRAVKLYALSIPSGMAAIPMLGPLGQQAGARMAAGDVLGAVTESGANSLMLGAPKPVARAAGAVLGPVTRSLMKVSDTFRTGAQSLVGAGARNVKAAVAGEAESSFNTAENTRAANKAADERTLESRGKVDTANTEARKAAIEQTREQESSHAKETAEAKAHNDEVLRTRAKRVETQTKLDEKSAEMRGRIETAREKALKVGNEKYSTVNEKLNSLPADNEAIIDAVTEATEKIKGSETEPAILKDITKKIEQGEGFTYEDEQGYYSELGTELSKGTLAGDVYTAMDTLHEAIGADMQRIAESQGMGKQLKAARDYWRRMKQTFGKPWAQNDNATAALKTANPDFLKSDEYQNRIRMLGSFDGKIPKVAENVANLRNGLEELGAEKPLRQEVKSLPEKPPRVKPAVKPYGEPNATKPIERPAINTLALREKLIDSWAKSEASLNKWQVRALITGPLAPFFGEVFGRGGLEAGTIAAAGAMVYGLGPAVVAKLLDNSALRAWLAHPPAGELETLGKLPHADYLKITDGMKPVVRGALSRGFLVSPRILALLGISREGPATRRLQELRDQHRTATQ